MTPKGPRSERETVINFKEEDETATITASGQLCGGPLQLLGFGEPKAMNP